jgi:hypothetical protein
MDYPEWWEWELAYTGHLEARADERSFSDVELRTMLENATGLRPARRPGRFIVRTRHGGNPWSVVVEPDFDDKLVFVVTAYPRTDES